METRTVTDPVSLALRELNTVSGLVSFATGKTFAPFFSKMTFRGRATHLDELVGTRAMADEILAACPGLELIRVPNDASGIVAHEQRLRDEGGVALQFLGLGTNGHLAFNEPGTPADLGFHIAELAVSTRAHLAPRFEPGRVPTHAVTAGLRSILSAKRIVLVATGSSKRDAVEAMLKGDPGCPASCLLTHPSVLVLLDAPATPKR